MFNSNINTGINAGIAQQLKRIADALEEINERMENEQR